MFSPLELKLQPSGKVAGLLALPWLLLAGLPWLTQIPVAHAASTSLLLAACAGLQTIRLTRQASNPWIRLQLDDSRLHGLTARGQRIRLELDPASRVFSRGVLLNIRPTGGHIWHPVLLTDLPWLANCDTDSLRKLRVVLRFGHFNRISD